MGVRLDSADNAVLELNAAGRDRLTVFSAHTRQEWIETPSLERGLCIAIETMLHFS